MTGIALAGSERPDYNRVWLGAFRPLSANSQYEFEWVNGIRQDLRPESWQIMENSWPQKCLYTFARKTAQKRLFYMADCQEQLFFDDVLCEKMATERQRCITGADCHELASCVVDRCVCSPGYAGNGYYCFDIDECCGTQSKTTETYLKCEQNDTVEHCTNTWGSYNLSQCDHKLQLIGNDCHQVNPCSGEACEKIILFL